MKLSDLFQSAVVGLWQHKFRTLLTLSGVALGSLLLFMSLSGGLGVLESVNRRLSIGDRLLQVRVQSGIRVNSVSVQDAREAGFTQGMSDERRIRMATASGVGGREIVPLNLAAARELGSIEHVTEVWPMVEFRTAMRFEQSGTWAPATVKAVRSVKDLSPYVVVGHDLSDDSAKEVLVNEVFLYHQNIRSDAEIADVVGTEVQILPLDEEVNQALTRLAALPKTADGDDKSLEQSRRDTIAEMNARLAVSKLPTDPFQIAGVLKSPSVEELRLDPELYGVTQNVLMSHELASEIWSQMNRPDRQIQATVQVDLPEHVKDVEKAIQEIGFRTVSLSEIAGRIRSAALLITTVVTALAAAALLIAGIGITNTMVMNVLERRREIAIMKSIGAQESDISRIFLLEGMLIGVLGGGFGLALGYLLSSLTSGYIQRTLEQRLDESFGDEIFAYPIWLILATPAVAILVTTLASAIPARQAARVDPVATLQAT